MKNGYAPRAFAKFRKLPDKWQYYITGGRWPNLENSRAAAYSFLSLIIAIFFISHFRWFSIFSLCAHFPFPGDRRRRTGGWLNYDSSQTKGDIPQRLGGIRKEKLENETAQAFNKARHIPDIWGYLPLSGRRKWKRNKITTHSAQREISRIFLGISEFSGRPGRLFIFPFQFWRIPDRGQYLPSSRRRRK